MYQLKATMYGSCVCLFTEQIFRIRLSYSCICFENVSCFVLLHHTISLKVALYFYPIRSPKTKTNRESLTHVFPRFRDSSIFWFWFYYTQLRTALKIKLVKLLQVGCGEGQKTNSAGD